MTTASRYPCKDNGTSSYSYRNDQLIDDAVVIVEDAITATA
ncbi:hypothetical protein C496_08139 [Natronorubrum tibetense GA33]|uniref:Uncharacterized protein n=1 Tax=Natronorubrum tibetense GA33 TaxID=1114856 RepID=L9W134_9EURY|nr:hypothetical protein C496_08139 [Natronorubrum tibetense GA33]